DIGLFDQVLRVAAVAAAGIEYVLSAADIKGPGTKKAGGQGLMTGQPAGDRCQGPRQTIVVFLDELAGNGKRTLEGLLRFKHAPKFARCGGFHGRSLFQLSPEQPLAAPGRIPRPPNVPEDNQVSRS